MRGHPLISECFLTAMSYLPHVKEPAMKGHLFCGAFLCHIQMSFEDRFQSITTPRILSIGEVKAISISSSLFRIMFMEVLTHALSVT